MNPEFIEEHLKLPPEQQRVALMYPDLLTPIPFATADPEGPQEEEDGSLSTLAYGVAFEISPRRWVSAYVVGEQHHRIITEYEAARDRQEAAEETCAAARWDKPKPHRAPPPREPDPEDIPPEGKLTPRQEEFCRHYAEQPVGTRAAVLAGYSEENAAPYGSRLLNNPLVLDRIAKLRAEKQIRYVLERDTMHDKLEAVFFGALAERNHAGAVAALRLQAMLGGVLGHTGSGMAARKRKSQGKPRSAREKAKESQPKKPTKAEPDRA